MLEGMSTWPARDIIIVVGIVATFVFNVGGFFYLVNNHLAHLKDSLHELVERVRATETDIAWIKGMLKRNDRASQ